MSRPPLPPRSGSPSIPSFNSSEDSLASIETEEIVASERIREFFQSFDAAERFSQIGPDRGRGIQVVKEMHAVLVNVWMRSDQSQPDLCFDRHDGRPSRTIYSPPQRWPGGIMRPCRLSQSEREGDRGSQSVSIVHHHISVHSENKMGDDRIEKKPSGRLKRQKVQSHFKSSSAQKNTRERNKGRFVRKTLAPVTEISIAAPSIPLAPGGIHDILQQWVQGDISKGLQIPLCEFTYEMINAKDPSGKKHKSLFSKRKTVSVAVLLAVREAREENKPFAEVFHLEALDHDILKVSMTKWEKYARQYLSKKEERCQDKRL